VSRYRTVWFHRPVWLVAKRRTLGDVPSSREGRQLHHHAGVATIDQGQRHPHVQQSQAGRERRQVEIEATPAVMKAGHRGHSTLIMALREPPGNGG